MRKTAILTGPTATGKTELALAMAERHGLEIVNADSMLVYRGMDIGTAKPTAAERARVVHHLIDIRDPDEPYTAADFRRDALRAIAEIEQRGKRALITGGTGFYLKSLLFGLWEAPAADPALREELEKRDNDDLYRELFARDEEAALRIGRNDRYRLVRALEMITLSGKTPSELQAAQPKDPDPRFELWVVDRESEELHERIAQRTGAMLDAGFLDEVRSLRAGFPEARALSAVGYREALLHLEGKAPPGRKLRKGVEGLRAEIELGTRQLVKKQRTFFRGLKSARWFTLERDRPQLEQAFEETYSGSRHP